MDADGVQRIQPAQTQLAGETLQAVCDARPDLFPAGLELIVMAPGQLAPIGKLHVPPGQIVALLPPGMSKALRGAVDKAIAQAQAQAKQQGKVAAPGFTH